MSGDDGAADDATRRVDLPARVVAAIEERVAATEFESVDAYAAFALELVLRDVERLERDDDAAPGRPAAGSGTGAEAGGDGATDADGSRESGEGTDGVDDEAVRDRLDSLGYL